MKKTLAKALLIISLLAFSNKVYAQEKTVNIHLFWSIGCPHCAHEKDFLEKWVEEDPTIKVFMYEISKNTANGKLFSKVASALSASSSGVPFTVIGNHHFVGFSSDESFTNAIKEMAKQAKEEDWLDVVTGIKEASTPTVKPTLPAKGPTPEAVKVPILGNIDIKNLSLPTLTVVLALADGFNPCAMWVLLFLISLLLGIENRKKMWLMGGTFIGASGLVYFLVLAAWLNLFLFLGFVPFIRFAIGSVAVFLGYKYLKDYRTNKDGGCKVIGKNKDRQKIFEKLKNLVLGDNLAISLVGIALLAFAVNVVEFVCSAGLPAVFTNILTLNNLPSFTYYMYLVLYVVIFMLDDMLIFVIAMTTLRAVGIQSKYARLSNLIGGLLMLGIGFAMIFKPELLMLG